MPMASLAKAPWNLNRAQKVGKLFHKNYTFEYNAEPKSSLRQLGQASRDIAQEWRPWWHIGV
jgi:hypothetical protein